MNVIDRYFSEISRILDDVMTSQREALERAAEAIADATMAHRNVFTFGCSHAGLLSLELFYRTGGLATVNPIRAPGAPHTERYLPWTRTTPAPSPPRLTTPES